MIGGKTREKNCRHNLPVRSFLYGDGQCDSPGFSGKDLCYYVMEMTTGYVVEMEVLDKRHVSLKSSTMEKKALTNCLQRLQTVLNVLEVCTDVSSSIKKLICMLELVG